MTEVHDPTEIAVAGTEELLAEPARFSPPRAKGTSRLASVWPPLLLGTVILGAWYLITYVVLDDDRRFLMPAPHAVLSDGFFGETRQGDATISVIGLAISIVVGVTVAVLMSQSPRVERAVFPYMVMLQATPILALVPLIGFWFGYSTNPRIIVCVIISLFPIIVNTLFGLQSAERGMHELFTLQHVGRLTRLRKLMFPAGLPAIFAGLRISAGLSVIGAIVGDFFFGQGTPGLGQLLRKYSANLQGEELFTAVIMAALLGVVIFLAVNFLERRV